MHSVPTAKPKKPWITWTRVDTTATIVATVAVLEFIAIGYGVLRYTTNQRIKNKVEGKAEGVVEGKAIQQEAYSDYYSLGFDHADRDCMPVPSLYHGGNVEELTHAQEFDKDHPGYVYESINIFHQHQPVEVQE